MPRPQKKSSGQEGPSSSKESASHSSKSSRKRKSRAMSPSPASGLVTQQARKRKVGSRTPVSSSADQHLGTSQSSAVSSAPLAIEQLASAIDTIVDKVYERMMASHPNAGASLLDQAAAQLTASITGQASSLSNLPVTAVPSLLPEVPSLSAGSFLAPTNGHLASAVVPLDSALTPAIKGKIWTDEYVHFGQLLNPNQGSEYSVSVVNNAMQLNPVAKTRGIHDIDQWSEAFTIFSSVYLEKYPHQARPLLKYGYTIREMAKKYPLFAWRQYDESFRQARVSHLWPWDSISYELYIKAISQAVTDSAARGSNAYGAGSSGGYSATGHGGSYPGQSSPPFYGASRYRFPPRRPRPRQAQGRGRWNGYAYQPQPVTFSQQSPFPQYVSHSSHDQDHNSGQPPRAPAPAKRL